MIMVLMASVSMVLIAGNAKSAADPGSDIAPVETTATRH
jgi:hypothetical protein